MSEWVRRGTPKVATTHSLLRNPPADRRPDLLRDLPRWSGLTPRQIHLRIQALHIQTFWSRLIALLTTVSCSIHHRNHTPQSWQPSTMESGPLSFHPTFHSSTSAWSPVHCFPPSWYNAAFLIQVLYPYQLLYDCNTFNANTLLPTPCTFHQWYDLKANIQQSARHAQQMQPPQGPRTQDWGGHLQMSQTSPCHSLLCLQWAGFGVYEFG